MLPKEGLACFVLEQFFPRSKTLPLFSPFSHINLLQLSTHTHSSFLFLLFWNTLFTSMFALQTLTISGSSSAWTIGLCHADMTEATTISGGQGPSVGTYAAVGSGLDTRLAVAGGSLPATSFLSHSITLLSSEMTSLPGSISGVTDGSFGLLNSEPIAEIKARVRELQEENKALEVRLAQLTGGEDTTLMKNDASSMHIAKCDLLHMENCRDVERLTLDITRLYRMLDYIRTTALELKAKCDITHGIRIVLEADIAAMKKEIGMGSGLQLKLQAKRARLKQELYFITNIQHEMKHKQTQVTLLGPLMSTETEIIACKMKLQTLLIHLHNLIGVNRNLLRTLAKVQAQESSVISGYQAKIARLKAAIGEAKYELQEQIIAHKEVAGLLQALGTETETYWALLDGEELCVPIQINCTSSSTSPSESLADLSRTSSSLNPFQADIVMEAQLEETKK